MISELQRTVHARSSAPASPGEQGISLRSYRGGLESGTGTWTCAVSLRADGCKIYRLEVRRFHELANRRHDRWRVSVTAQIDQLTVSHEDLRGQSCRGSG